MKKKKAARRKKKVLLIERRLLGTRVIAGGAAIPSAYNVYQEYFEDGSQKVTHGLRMFGVGGGGLDKEVSRPELFELIHACSVLLKRLENVCYQHDLKRLPKAERWV